MKKCFLCGAVGDQVRYNKNLEMDVCPECLEEIEENYECDCECATVEIDEETADQVINHMNRRREKYNQTFTSSYVFRKMFFLELKETM
jgi:hypothetical protein